MIDPAVRDAPLIEALSDRGIGVILLDVVIGYGAHPDPAGHLAGVLKAHTGSGPLVVASVTGTETDPQGWSRQASILTGAGVLVAPSNADAAALALACLEAR
jgi:FdrA protein